MTQRVQIDKLPWQLVAVPLPVIPWNRQRALLCLLPRPLVNRRVHLSWPTFVLPRFQTWVRNTWLMPTLLPLAKSGVPAGETLCVERSVVSSHVKSSYHKEGKKLKSMQAREAHLALALEKTWFWNSLKRGDLTWASEILQTQSSSSIDGSRDSTVEIWLSWTERVVKRIAFV